MSPAADDVRALLAQWDEWLGAHTDGLLSLEERCRTAGSAADQADVAAAFVARKAISGRIEAIRANAASDPHGASSLASAPVTDDLGGPVGNDLNDAATLLDAIVQRVEQRVTAVERRQLGDAEARQAIDTDLAAAAVLAESLGMHQQHIAHLREQLGTGGDLTSLAADAADARAELESAGSERQRLLDALAAAPERVTLLAAEEEQVRELAARCRDKVVQAPPLAVPSVPALGELPDLDEVRLLPWTAARARIAPALAKLDRLHAALAEARRRFQAALAHRDDLRGLLESYRDKAASKGLGEDPGVEPMYREAASVLWSAPCDLVRAKELVDRYVAAVNARSVEAPR